MSTQFPNSEACFTNDATHNTVCFLGLPGAPVELAGHIFKHYCQNQIAIFNTDELIAKYFSKSSFTEVVCQYPEPIWRAVERIFLTTLLGQTDFNSSDDPEINVALLKRLTTPEAHLGSHTPPNIKYSSYIESVFAPIMHLSSTTRRIVILGSGAVNAFKNLQATNKLDSTYCVIVDLDISIALRNSLSVGGAIRLGQPRALWMQMAKARLKEIESVADYKIDGHRLLSAL